ncbi:isoflavone 3' [Panicum miliaceum]|uniref:Isoflavone 3 n=1 Tax=Panicum miliaceum TaxID=4540 RepID=A0A3L6TF76_PANMI|nr:isoflavone 3' [Panicum miliaceum]
MARTRACGCHRALRPSRSSATSTSSGRRSTRRWPGSPRATARCSPCAWAPAAPWWCPRPTPPRSASRSTTSPSSTARCSPRRGSRPSAAPRSPWPATGPTGATSAASPPCSSSPSTASPACPPPSPLRCVPWCARVQLKRRLFEVTLSVLMETIARTKTSRTEADADTDMSPEAQVFKQIVDDIVPQLGTANLWDYLPVLRWFDVFGVINKLVAAVGRRDVFLRRLIDAERRRQDGGGGDNEKKSMIAVPLSLQKSEPEVYTDTMIKSLCVNMFGAGTETTSTTAEWAMALLLNHPEKLKKAQAEIDAAAGTSTLINETLRLYPPAPLLLPHESSADCKVGGYDVPRGTMLLVNVYAIHRDPRCGRTRASSDRSGSRTAGPRAGC